MIRVLNRLVDLVEEQLTGDLEVGRFATEAGVTEYHLRRMFSSLAAMPLSEYVRRRRMTVAAAEVLGDGDLLEIATRYGYGSTEAFGRAFHAVHGMTPGDARRRRGPLHTQPTLRFRLTVEGTAAMSARIVTRPGFALIGHAARVPLVHRGTNPDIVAHLDGIAPSEHVRLKSMSELEPRGLLQVTADVDAGDPEGTELTYLHGVAVDAATPIPADLDVIAVAPGEWAVFRTTGPHPDSLQTMWAATATEWFPANPWQMRPGPSLVAILDRSADFSSADCELWLPIERT